MPGTCHHEPATLRFVITSSPWRPRDLLFLPVVILTAELDVINTVSAEFRRGPIVLDATRTTAKSYSGYLVRTRMGSASAGGNPMVWLDVSILDPNAHLSLGPDRIYLQETPQSDGGWVHLLADIQADYRRQLDKQLYQPAEVD